MTMRTRGAIVNRSMGQSLVETALVLPFLLTLVFGVFELGRIVFVFSAVNNASREATRYGAATGSTLGGVPRYLNCSAIRQTAIDTAFLAGLTADDIEIHYDEPAGSDMQVYAHCVGSTARDIGTNAVISSGDVSLGDRVVITVTKQINPILPLFPSFTPTFVTARTILKDIAIGPPECSDGADNDNDGAVDFPDDDGCTSADDTTETICYRLFVSVVPEDGGTIGYNPGTNCANRYIEQTGVNLEAISDIRNDPTLRPEYTFDFWQGPVDTGDGSNTNPTTVTMDGNKDVTAHFRRVEANLSIQKTATPEPVHSGQPLRYIIEIANGGLDVAHNLVMTDTVPTEVTYVAWSSPDGGTCDEPVALPNLVCRLDELAVGDNAIFYVDVIAPVYSNASEVVENTAGVRAFEYDPVLSNNNDIYFATVLPRAELKMTKTASADPVQAADFFEYTLLVQNSGPSLATNVVVLDTLPTALTLDLSSLPAECSFDSSTREIRCVVSQIFVGSSWQTNIRVQAPDEGQPVSNTATVDSDEVEADMSDNTDSVSITVESLADLDITKSGPASASRDTTFDYTITVRNDGPSTAREVRLEDTLPAGLQYSSHNNASGNCGLNGATVVCSLGNIPGGQSRQVTLTVLPVSESTFENVATVESAGLDPVPDPDLTNNTSNTVVTVVSADVELTVDKTASATSVDDGQAFSYSIQVANQGPSNATNVQFTDTLPDEVSFVGVDGGAWTDCSYSASSHEVSCAPDDGLLVAGQGTTIVINVEASGTGSFSNTAILSAAEATASDTVGVSANPQLDVSLSISGPQTATPGVPFDYTVTLANAGPSSAATASVVIDLQPSDLIIGNASGAGWSCQTQGQQSLCNATAPLDEGSTSITITVTPNSLADVIIDATVTASDDGNSANDSDSLTTTVPAYP